MKFVYTIIFSFSFLFSVIDINKNKLKNVLLFVSYFLGIYKLIWVQKSKYLKMLLIDVYQWRRLLMGAHPLLFFIYLIFYNRFIKN